MPMSGGFQSEMPGLTCRAWAVVDLGTLTVKKGFNIASISGTGPFTFTFSAALPNTDYFVKGRVNESDDHTQSALTSIYVNTKTTANASMNFYNSGSTKTTGISYVSFWA